MWSFMFLALGFPSQWLDHSLSLSVSQKEQLLLFAPRWPTIHRSSGQQGSSVLLTSLVPPSIIGTQEVQLPPHRAPHSEARHPFHLLSIPPIPPPPAPAVACCFFPWSLCQGPRDTLAFLLHVCLTSFSYETHFATDSQRDPK